MKDIIKEISKWTSIIISVLMFAVSCSDDKEDGAPEEPVPAAPTITNFVPPHGVPGVTITITGTDLKEVSEVTIGGKEVALVGEATDTEIKVMTTEEVTGGKIKVTTPYGTAETVSEFVVDEVFQVPSLITVPQDNVSYLDIITLEGENLDIVEKVFFGNVEAKIIREDEATRAVEGASGTELKVEVPYYKVVIGESVNLFLEYTDGNGQLVKKDTEKSFTVTPRAPRLENVSSLEADFFESVSLEGTDLNLVEKVLFGTTEATIDKESSNNTVLKVTVPYYEEEEAVKITLIYRYGEKDDMVEGRKSDSADEFAAKKVKPENVECPASVMLGTSTFEITGNNLDKVEKVLFNGTEITSTLSDDKMKLICSLPSTVEASINNTITIVYWQENKKEVIRSDFGVKESANYIWKKRKLYGNLSPKVNFISGITGLSYTPCEFEANSDIIHLHMTSTSTRLRIETLNATANFVEGFECEGKLIPKSGLKLRFCNLIGTTGAQKEYHDLVKNDDGKLLETVPLSTSKADSEGLFKVNKPSIRYEQGVAATEDVMEVGDVGFVAVMDMTTGKKVERFGLFELLEVNLEESSMTLNFYFEKESSQIKE